MEAARAAVLVCDDLLFSSSILGHARHHGVQVRLVRKQADAIEAARTTSARLAIIDLHVAGLEFTALATELREAGVTTLLGYGSHVDTATLSAARDAGFDMVMPRSQFVRELPEQIGAWAG